MCIWQDYNALQNFLAVAAIQATLLWDIINATLLLHNFLVNQQEAGSDDSYFANFSITIGSEGGGTDVREWHTFL